MKMEFDRRWLDPDKAGTDLAARAAEIAADPQLMAECFGGELEFGTAGLRGILDAGTARMNRLTVGKATQGLAQVLQEEYEDPGVAIAYDSRHFSRECAEEAAGILAANGVHVWIYPELMPTPALSYAVRELGCQSGIMITASHNPKEYNGLKMTFNKRTLTEQQIKEVRDITFKNWLSHPEAIAEVSQEDSSHTLKMTGKVAEVNIIPNYIKDMENRFGKIGEGVKVVVDSANATGGVVGPELYKKLGCEVVELFSEQDGNFPNHHPNPSVEKTLDTLKEVVLKEHADVGIAYDGDSDRIGIIDTEGRFLTGDKLLLIYAQDLIEACKDKNIHPTVVSEVKCSQVLFDTIDKLGGHSVMCKTGHGYIKDKMKETGALLAGEMSGHTFFKDRYYGFDDAIYAGCRIIEIIAKHKKINQEFKISDMLKAFDEVYSSAEVRYPCPNELKKSTLEKVKSMIEADKNIFGSQIKDIITLDGMRIVFDGGFALIRQSNTEPVFTLRFEAKTKEECEKLKSAMLNMLGEILK